MIPGVFPCLVALAVGAQVPPPAASSALDGLRERHRAVLLREADQLSAVAKRLDDAGQPDRSRAVRELIPPPPVGSGPTRFSPLPEIVAESTSGLAAVSPSVSEGARVKEARKAAAKDLMTLAHEAATLRPRSLALADECLRGVIARDPDHAEARRLLGFVRSNGGWATPFAAAELKNGKTLHPTFGWVPRAWVPRLEQGQLPVRVPAGAGKEVWGTAAEADEAHRDWSRAWVIRTEHFQIKTNVPLSKAIAFGRHLETLHELFTSLFADVLGDSLPLAQRFRDPKQTGERRGDPHAVSFFADREGYVEHLRSVKPDIDRSIGFYKPPVGRAKRGHAYFFRNEGGQIEASATLYHEVSHQLLFESGVATATAYQNNAGHFWVFEGLGTYFETLQFLPDGTVTVGGRVGPRLEAARTNLPNARAIVPTEDFVRLSEAAFGRDDEEIYRRYQQAMALTLFLMQAEGGRYRGPFLDYVRDACQGRLRRASGLSLSERLGVPYDRLDALWLAYLKGRDSGT